MGVKTQSCVLFLWMYTLTLVRSQECTLKSFLTGSMFDSNYDTTNLAATYASGDQVRVGCNVGFSGFFKLICIQGNWQSKGQACQPRSCGHPGEASYADFHLEKGDDFVFGSQVLYTCHKGYQMVSRTNIRRCMAAGWDGVVPVCEARQCPVMYVDNNVQVVGNPEEAAYGNVLRFSCKLRSEILSGSQELYCDENGEWSDQAPTCKEVTCTAPDIPNGLVTGNINEYKANEYLSFRCNPSYKVVDGRPSKCLKSGIRPNWSPTPACEPIVCKLPQTSLEGTQYEPASNNVFSPGETVRVTCGNEYWIDNKQVKSAVITCKQDGEWTLRPVCQEVTCSNRRPEHVTQWAWHERITLGMTARYRCAKGYKKPRGVDLATCTRKGWSPDPVCQGLCSKPDVPHGIVTHPNNNTVYYNCEKGYKLFTKGWWATAKCKNDNWSGLEQCIANTTCGKLPVILHGKVTRRNGLEGSKAQITCNPGYSENIQQLTCSEGEWLSNEFSPETICTPTAQPCNPPPKVDNAVVEASYQKEYLSDSEVTYICRKNYMMEGEPQMICKDGQWKEHVITCTPYCDTKGFRAASMSFTADKERYFNGEAITYRCVTGSVEGIATCSNTRWNKTEECKASLACGRPPFLTNGDTKETALNHYRQNDWVEYTCQRYHTMEGESFKTCIHGEWIGEMKCLRPCTTDKEAMRSHNIKFKHVADEKLYSHHLQWIGFACTGQRRHVGLIEMRQQCFDGVMQLPTCQWDHKCFLTSVPEVPSRHTVLLSMVEKQNSSQRVFYKCVSPCVMLYYCSLGTPVGQSMLLPLIRPRTTAVDKHQKYRLSQAVSLPTAKVEMSFIFLLLQLWMSGKVSSSHNGCSGIPNVPNAQVSEQPPRAEYQKGDVLRFTCDTGYISGLTITYICSPQSGGWAAVRGRSCYLKPCELPEDTDNGYYQIIDGEDFVFGTKIKYFCNEGYQMVSREDTRTCLLDRWSNHVPICERSSCEAPTLGEGVRVQGLPENEGRISPGRFLTFSCDDPEQNLNDSSLLVCGEDGQWNKPFPSCDETACEVGPLQPHVNVNGLPAKNEKMKNGHKLRFHCDNQLTIQGSQEIECLPTGKWNAAFPTCTASLACGRPPFLTNGDTKETALNHYRQNDWVEYTCQRYHTMEGESFKTCIHGEWIGEMKCLRPCTTDKEAMRSHNIKFKHVADEKLYSHHLQWIGFACTGQRRHVGLIEMRQQCFDGVMQLPTCQ
ncbi:complement factor H-like [Spinachia spinachia]